MGFHSDTTRWRVHQIQPRRIFHRRLQFQPFWVRWSFCALESATVPHNPNVGRSTVVDPSHGTEYSLPALNSATLCFATSAQTLPAMAVIRYPTGVSNALTRGASEF